ncbi:hypothetical protein [Coleofasciculus sp. E1-EBD-02]
MIARGDSLDESGQAAIVLAGLAIHLTSYFAVMKDLLKADQP